MLSSEAKPHDHVQGETGDNASQVGNGDDVKEARYHQQGAAQQDRESVSG